MKRSAKQSHESKLAEYAAANSIYLTYDGFRWQAGTFLVAGVFVYWGFLLGADPDALVSGVASILIALIMSCWLYFAYHYRQLYLFKLARLHELEIELGMQQHRRFSVNDAARGLPHVARGPKGHHLDIFVYVFTTVGSGFLTMTVSGASWWAWGPSWWFVAVCVIATYTTVHVAINERRIQADLAKVWPQDP